MAICPLRSGAVGSESNYEFRELANGVTEPTMMFASKYNCKIFEQHGDSSAPIRSGAMGSAFNHDFHEPANGVV